MAALLPTQRAGRCRPRERQAGLGLRAVAGRLRLHSLLRVGVLVPPGAGRCRSQRIWAAAADGREFDGAAVATIRGATARGRPWRASRFRQGSGRVVDVRLHGPGGLRGPGREARASGPEQGEGPQSQERRGAEA